MSMMAIISKLYCSSSQTVLGVRKRPHVVNGGGRSTAGNLDTQVQRVEERAVVSKVLGATRLEAVGGLLKSNQ